MILTLLLKCILTRSTLTWEALNRPKNVRINFNSNAGHVLPSDCLTFGNVCDPASEEQLGIYRCKLQTGSYKCKSQTGIFRCKFQIGIYRRKLQISGQISN